MLFSISRRKEGSYERRGRLKSTRSGINIAAVADLGRNDRRTASRMIAESLNIPKTLVIRILKEDLGKRKTHFRINIPKHINFIQ